MPVSTFFGASFLGSGCPSAGIGAAPTVFFGSRAFFNVEFSTNGGSTWTVLKHSSGLSSGWNGYAPQASYSLPTGSSTCKIRFRLTSDVSVTDFGAAVDDIVVTAN